MIDEVIYEISKTENCRILSIDEIRKIPYLKNKRNVIEIDTDLSSESGYVPVILYLTLENAELPSIYINEDSYETIKFVPHVNQNFSICIVEDESISFFEANLPKISKYFIHKAKEILTIKSSDKETEFKDEFKAYWEIQYNGESTIYEAGVALITNDAPIKCVRFTYNFNFFKFLLYTDSEESSRLFKFLDAKKIKYYEIQPIEVVYDKILPPFDMSFTESIKLLSDEQVSIFRKKINKEGFESVLFFFRNDKHEYYGWLYEELLPKLHPKILKGHKYSNWEKIALPLYKASKVRRISFSNIEKKRLDVRTAGQLIDNDKKVCIIGLGSIGSQLLQLLTKMPFNQYKFVDHDFLKIENIARHQYGFSDINKLKVDIAERYITEKNPFVKVLTFSKSIVKLLSENEFFFENDDFIFIVLGITRYEIYILDYLMKNNITKPVIIIWVEAYLSGGQMIFSHPKDFSKTKELISDFQYRVLDENVYLREGSCQGTYMPYSMEHINLFLTSIFAEIYKIVNRQQDDSMVYTWFGDLDFVKAKNLKLTTFAQNKESFSLFKTKI